MSTENTSPEAILEAIKKIDLLSELQDDKNKNNLKMIAEGKLAGGKQIGPYARLLTFAPGEVVMREGEWGGNTFFFSLDAELDVFTTHETNKPRKVGAVPPGTCFGEMSILAGVPRNATIISSDNGQTATVLEMVRPALRLLRSLKKFADRVDGTYRSHGLGNTIAQLRDSGVQLTTAELSFLESASQFNVFGKHHVLTKEGAPIESLYLVHSGWLRRVRGVPIYEEITEGAGAAVSSLIHEDFLGAGNCLGLEALAGQSVWQYSTELMARSEVLEVALTQLRKEPELAQQISKALAHLSKADDPLVDLSADKSALAATEKEIATGIVDGVNLLVMDMDLCVRCGNCSLACHKVHGQSRLLRRGIHIERPVKIDSPQRQHVLSPSVCMHCKDPECLTGCPTGAIFREATGDIDINIDTCIGCFDCATQCPYNAITMVPRNLPPPAKTAPLTRARRVFSLKAHAPAPIAESDDMIAVKCNLCEGTPLNPPDAKRPAYSCEENCPTGALVRVDPQEYFPEIEKTLGLVFRDRNHAIGRNIHKNDPIARIWHVAGIAVTLALTILLAWVVRRYGFNQPLSGTWLTLRWLTGILGFVGIAVVMTYPARKPIYRRRAGALRYWLLAHIYLGVISAVVLLFHGGNHGGGLLTLVLMLWFDVTILTGLWGIGCYLVVPRIMTSIEGDPLLIEDLEGRRAELRAELDELRSKCDEETSKLIDKKFRKYFESVSYLLKQYWQREELTASLAKARLRFKAELLEPSNKEIRNRRLKIVERWATLRRVEALIYLHRLLKVWIAPHVISTSVMLALMIVHIVQVIFFNVR
ncbi:MAG TPA: cyclic nucleotide-binding domain-containing protein [Pyrinomonadaceae bacterium]|jgi:Fe-S-cluster-containing dehydrogenase component/CRP-like cAMP-binding protein|nr:cyclic nucleotide-binding domain-containing protein [Pyrinomonadaceae bacterium]